ncbi:hypothetical protein [Halomonas ramblicola]|nr:hypothetical protein [Halomonas ramblicola]MDN3521370.1 hypothetical protein [Halomonas ramblicola]
MTDRHPAKPFAPVAQRGNGAICGANGYWFGYWFTTGVPTAMS